MKTMNSRFSLRPTHCALMSLAAAIATLCAHSAMAASVITSVVETGGDNEPTDTITAKWTGQIFPVSIANEPVPGAVVGSSYTVGTFADWAPAFVDRNHRYTNAGPVAMPAYLVGNDYIMSGNDNRDNPSYLLDVTVGTTVRVYMLIDNRLSDGDGNTPPTFGPTSMQWILDGGWTPVTTGINRTSDTNLPDEIGLDESADGSINQWYSIYAKVFPAGTFQLKQPDNGGRNMYGVVIASATPPPAPTLAAVGSDSKVTLDWTAAPGAAGFVVNRSTTSGGPYEIIATNVTTRYVDESVVNGTTYYYVVSAFNDVGESGNSNEANATPMASPTGVVAIGGTGQAEVQWASFAGAASYSLRRSSDSGGPYETVASGIAGTSHVDTGLLSGRHYYYVVAAQLTAGGESGQSEEAAALTAPGTPSSVTASLYAATVFQLAWRISDPVVDSFNIEESLDNSLFQPIASVPGTDRSYQIPGIFPNEIRYYRVTAVNSTGASSPSRAAAATAPAQGWNINFANAINGTPANDPAPTPAGFFQDIGELYGPRSGGLVYGWDRDITADSRWRKSASDVRYATFNHLQKATPSAIWELELPNGFYSVRVVAGDADNLDSVFQFDLEGVLTPAISPGGASNFREFNQTVIINDGALTVTSGPDAANNKIAFVDVYPAVAEPLAIGTQPQGMTVDENRTVTLTVSVSGGSSPFTYRWFKDGVEVPDSTSYTASPIGTLTIPAAKVDQSGAYTVEIANFAGSVTSQPATLTIVPDTTGPRAVRAYSNVTNFTELFVEFDETLGFDEATSPFNYALGVDGPISADLGADGKTVTLIFGSPLVLNTPYELSILFVADLAGNLIDPNPTILNFVAGVVELPALAVARSGDAVTVSWAASATGFTLQQTDLITIPAGNTTWTTVGVAPTVANGRNVVTLPVSGNRFFRLRK